jgi:hypothetical protein
MFCAPLQGADVGKVTHPSLEEYSIGSRWSTGKLKFWRKRWLGSF